MIQQAPGAGYQDLGPGLERLNLRRGADPAVDCGAADFRAPAESLDGLVNLLGQLTRGGDDQRSSPPGWAAEQPVQDGQDEGCGLAGPGLRQPQHVAACEYEGYGLFLDRGGQPVTGGPDSGGDRRIERKLFKIH